MPNQFSQDEQARIDNAVKEYEDKQREQLIQEEINRRIADTANICAE